MEVLRCKARSLLLLAWPRRVAGFKVDAEGIFSVSKLVDEVTSVAPDGEVRIGRWGVEGGARAVLIVVVEEISRIAVSGTGRAREVVEGDVGRPPVAVGVGRNGEGRRLLGRQPSSPRDGGRKNEQSQRRLLGHVTGSSSRDEGSGKASARAVRNSVTLGYKGKKTVTIARDQRCGSCVNRCMRTSELPVRAALPSFLAPVQYVHSFSLLGPTMLRVEPAGERGIFCTMMYRRGRRLCSYRGCIASRDNHMYGHLDRHVPATTIRCR